MDITGRIIAVLETRGGTSARTGTEWKVASYVLETQEQYPKKVCFEVFGTDRIAQFNIQMGQDLTISVDIDAHEYNGRWFNTIRAFRVAPAGQAAPAAMPADGLPPFAGGNASPFPPQQPAPIAPVSDGDTSGDLPF